MKRKTTVLINYFLSVLLIFSLGCTSEVPLDLPGTGDSVSLSFKLIVPSGKVESRAISSTQEREIKSLDILVFKESSGTETFDYKIKVDPSSITQVASTGQFTVGVRQSSSNYRFVLIANASEQIALLSATGQGKEEVLNGLIIRNPGKWDSSSTGYTPIPMWGETTVLDLSSTTAVTDIYLHRMLASIDLKVTGDAISKFELREVYIYNRKTRGRIVPDAVNWSTASNGVATVATLPPDNIIGDSLTIKYPTVVPGGWHYDINDGIQATEMTNIIYTFEAKAANHDEPLNATCLVVGGIYDGSTAKSYYRVDFENEAKTAYLDLLRNHKYTITIEDVLSPGSPDPDEAFEGRNGVDMAVTVKTWNLANQNVKIDRQYWFKVDRAEGYLFPGETSDRINVSTNHPDGIIISDIENISGNEGWVDVLLIDTGNGHKGLIWGNPDSEDGEAIITLKAGNLIYKIFVSTIRWAGSNIYYNGEYLTFDDVNQSDHANYQGVHFKWGSLYGIDPMDELYSSSITRLYPPTGGARMDIYSSYTLIPSESGNAAMGDVDKVAGTGDICKWLTDKGYAPGASSGKKWRMPTKEDISAAGWAEQYENGPVLLEPNLYGGRSIVQGGRIIDNRFFSGAGFRDGNGTFITNNHYYWTSSMYSTTSAYAFKTNTSFNTLARNKVYASPVRCILDSWD